MKLVYVPMVMALVVTTTGFTTTRGPRGRNLIGKMFTLSRNSGGISFYSSYLSPTTSYTSTTTRPTTPPTTYPSWTTYPPWTPEWTTAPPTRGVSVCLRYLTDYLQGPTAIIFTLSPSTTPLRLTSRSGLSYGLSFNSYSYPNLFFQPNIRFWSNIGPNFWTRLCLTVDTLKNVAQVFSSSSISVRKILPYRYDWSGEPVITFSGFDGQVTDVQIWDYPLRYREIYNYMVTGVYGPHRGTVLTWSSISYSADVDVVMEDVYEQQIKQSISSSKGKRRQLKGKKTTRNLDLKKARKRQLGQ